MKNQPRRRRWVAGALRAGRAAAFLTLATGINGTIAALEPRYEPIYIYLVAVVIVAWLGSLLLGVTTAIAAVILYDAMFSPVRADVSIGGLLPFVVAIGAAVMTRLARVPVERPRFAPVAAPPMLETSPPKVVEITPAAVDTSELEDLRAQLADAGRELDGARAQVERENKLRLETAATAKARLTGLQHELDSARNDAIEQAKRAATLHGQLDEATRRTHDLEKKLNDTMQELEVAWTRVDDEKARAGGQTAANEQRLKELERKANEALQSAVADLAARYQEPLATAKKSLEEAFTRIPVIESERDAARLAADQAAARVVALTEQLEEVRSRDTDEVRKLRAAAESLGEATAEREAARAEIQSLSARIESGQQEIARLRAELEDARSRTELERSNRERIEAELDRKIASIAAGLTSDYEESLGQAMVDKEAARAEIRSLSSKAESAQQEIAKLRGALEDARSRAELERSNRERIEGEVDRKIASIAAGLTSDYEESLGQAMVDREAARAEIRSLQGKIDDARAQIAQASVEKEAARAETRSLTSDLENMRSRMELERAAHEQALREFDRKIESIVAGITNDHEQAIGEAMVEREAARAEMRSLSKKVELLQEQLRGEREKAAKADTEWGSKLQTIVNHLASDHEHDIGEKIVEAQTAKAEARDLNNRLKTLQQKLDLERDQHRQSVERLMAQREAARSTPPSTGSAVVLVVHSDAGMRAMSKHALEQAGYKVMTAADGLEALRVAGVQRPDVVLAEAVMPKMNGRELLQLLKARTETAGVKVILMSGGEVERGSDFRADDVLSTPVDFAAMKAALANVLTR